jgi:hypothetical protein
VVVFSDGSVYVFFRVGGVAVCAIDGRLMYAEGVSGAHLSGAWRGVRLS